MPFEFRKITSTRYFPSSAKNLVCLLADGWDDWTFKTLFYMHYFDENGHKYEIGNLKIGYFGQSTGRTSDVMLDQFEAIDKKFFSLGQDNDYYKNIRKIFSPEDSSLILSSLNDVVLNDVNFELIKKEEVFKTSLLRSVSLSSIHGQFRRILNGQAPLTNFHFKFTQEKTEKFSEAELEFLVEPETKPSTNMHVLIGRNGVGKTTILNNMVNAVLNKNPNITNGGYFTDQSWLGPSPLSPDFFSNLISISFSAFDPFLPPDNQPDPSLGTCYFYIGLKKILTEEGIRNGRLKEVEELREEFVESLNVCLSLEKKKSLWVKAIKKLESDLNFEEMGLLSLSEFKADSPELKRNALKVSMNLSSGHAIVLLSITKLIEHLEEKSLVLIDEPESHLHPPLLAAYVRALSDLLLSLNGVAIIATHSPVVLQEVPMSCVTMLRRIRSQNNIDRPTQETFGENVGILTREVFQLEVSKSGFHDLLTEDAQSDKSFEDILEEYGNQIGMEGRSILRALITNKNLNRS